MILQFEQIEESLKIARAGGKKVVFTNGCFDLIHVGHVRYLQEARRKGDLLFVGLNSDRSVQVLKGPQRPIQSENDRAEIMDAIKGVDFVCLFSEETPRRLIEKVKPDVLVKGGDWKANQIVGADFVQSYGGQVLSLTFIEGRSTTNIVQKMQSEQKP